MDGRRFGRGLGISVTICKERVAVGYLRMRLPRFAFTSSSEWNYSSSSSSVNALRLRDCGDGCSSLNKWGELCLKKSDHEGDNKPSILLYNKNTTNINNHKQLRRTGAHNPLENLSGVVCRDWIHQHHLFYIFVFFLGLLSRFGVCCFFHVCSKISFSMILEFGKGGKVCDYLKLGCSIKWFYQCMFGTL